MIKSGSYENSEGMTADNVAVVVAGLPRAGTTYVWQIVADILGGGVVKTHNYLDLPRPIHLLVRRDPRDCAVSHWRWNKNRTEPMTYEEMVHWAAYYAKYMVHYRHWALCKPLLLQYEAFWDAPHVLLDSWGRALPRPSASRWIELVSKHSMEANRKVAATVEQGQFDPETLIHPDHVHEGTPGTWKRFVRDPAIFTKLFEPQMKELGYQ